jgi:hypothetical protein
VIEPGRVNPINFRERGASGFRDTVSSRTKKAAGQTALSAFLCVWVKHLTPDFSKVAKSTLGN